MVVLLLTGVDGVLIPTTAAVSPDLKVYIALASSGLGLLACCREGGIGVSQDLPAQSRGTNGVSDNPACPHLEGHAHSNKDKEEAETALSSLSEPGHG